MEGEDWSAPLRGRVAIVTGGGRGLGRAISRRLAGAGARVVIAQRDLQVAEQTAASIRAEVGEAAAVRADVGRESDVEELVATVVERFGPPDILVNNAAITRCYESFLTMSTLSWEQVIRVNLTGAFFCCRAVVPHMVRRRSGKIINISSVGGAVPEPDCVHYCAAKGGLVMLTRSLALELATYNIQVNAVAPGAIAESEAETSTPLVRIPAGRFGRPAEVAEAVLYLAGPGADYVTGHVLVIDGGYMLV